MSRRAAAAGLLLAFACLFLGYTAGRAAGPASRPTPTFVPVRIPAAVSSQPTPSAPGQILEPNLATLTPRVAVEQPSPELRIVEKPEVPRAASSVAAARALALRQLGAAQFACVDRLWQRESGWNPLAHNPSSDAHGIPQAVPGSKMGPGWWSDPVVQVRWGLGYIASRYGTACSALAHSNAHNWY